MKNYLIRCEMACHHQNMGIYDRCEKDVKNCRPHYLKREDGLLRHVLSLRHVKVAKPAAMPARFVTNEVVTNRAGIAPFFSHLDISQYDIVSVTCGCVCVRACVCACVHQREREREGKRESQREI